MNDILDMRLVTQPKSDQINADDLIGGPITITIRDVKLHLGQDQPCSIYFEGSDKAYRPCKGMRFLLMQVWGHDAKEYVGKSLTLFRDPKIRFGADETGGVRISHMSHIDGKRVVPITLKKGVRKGWEILPLVAEQQAPAKPQTTPEEWVAKHIEAIGRAPSVVDLDNFCAKREAIIAKLSDELRQKCMDAYTLRRIDLETVTDDDLPEGL